MSWIQDIQGVTTLKSFLGTISTRRSVLKVGGLPISDNGSETVLNGVQTITGSGTWDGKAGIVLVKGTGARTIAIPDPSDPAESTTIKFVDAAGNSTGGNLITLDPSGSNTISGSTTKTVPQGQSFSIVFISAGIWQQG